MAQSDNRKRLEFLYNRGYTNGAVLHTMTGIPTSTIYDVIQRVHAGVNMEHRPGAGRPRLLDPNNRRRIVQLALKHPLRSAAEIGAMAASRGCPTVSSRTVQRSLAASGIFKLVPKPALALTAAQKEKRVLFCDQHLADDFSTTIFTDESSFLFERHRCPRWTAHGSLSVPTSKFSKSVMIWGGISTMGPTPLAVIPGTINQYLYQDILQEYLLGTAEAYYGENWRFQQDNATPHVARSTKQWLETNVPATLSWPPNSADLSPIENLWPLIKNNVEKNAPVNFIDFQSNVVLTWNEIDVDLLSRLIATVPNRLRACRDLRGEQVNLKFI